MLFAGCSNCRSIAPLWCAGQFMPHPPTPVQPSPMGPACQWCGPMPPVFTCMTCGMRQMLFIPGMPAPQAPSWGAPQLVAPVVQAPQGASTGQVREIIFTAVKGGAGPLGKAIGESLGAWMT